MPTKKSSGTDSNRAPAEAACEAAETPATTPASTASKAPATTAPNTASSLPCGPTRTTETFLGHAQAVLIVCKCANTIPANLARTLSELGVNGIPFQQAVRTAVNAAGYALGAADVPGAPGTRLVQIVTIIQNARRAV